MTWAKTAAAVALIAVLIFAFAPRQDPGWARASDGTIGSGISHSDAVCARTLVTRAFSDDPRRLCAESAQRSLVSGGMVALGFVATALVIELAVNREWPHE